MGKTTTFGGYFKQQRIESGKTLREFCRKHGLDPGNISKLERGRVPPPQNDKILRKYAQYLCLDEREWEEFQELAALESGKIPAYLGDADIAKKLPVLFRALKGQKITEEKLRQLVEMIRKA